MHTMLCISMAKYILTKKQGCCLYNSPVFLCNSLFSYMLGSVKYHFITIVAII